MNSTRRAAIVIIMVTILMNPALLAMGSPVPGRWEKVAQTKPGEKITVYTKDGVEQTFRYRTVDDQFLSCPDQNNKVLFKLKRSLLIK